MSTDGARSRVLPRTFTLTIEEHDSLGWVVTSDAHPGFLHLIHPEQGLADGLREVPMGLRLILVAQMDADAERHRTDAPAISNQE